MSRRHFLYGPLLAWLLAGMALHRLPGQTPGSSLWRYFSVDFLVFLVLWALCFHILFRSVARGIGGLAELPLPITHRNRLRWAIPVVSGLLLLLFLFFQEAAFTALGTGFFGGREMRFWLRKRRARFPG
ncbi:MAG: hypothetical protein AB2404_13095 [Planifilum fimeticola]